MLKSNIKNPKVLSYEFFTETIIKKWHKEKAHLQFIALFAIYYLFNVKSVAVGIYNNRYTYQSCWNKFLQENHGGG